MIKSVVPTATANQDEKSEIPMKCTSNFIVFKLWIKITKKSFKF